MSGSFRLPETITIWNEATDDGGGGKTWTRTTAPSRHALVNTQFRDDKGQLNVSKASVYSRSTVLAVGSMVLIGESSSSEPTADAEEVRGFKSTPSGTTLKVALL